MITFKKENNYFILVYIPDGDIQFLKDKFSANEVYKLNNVFEVKKDNIYGDFNAHIKNNEIEFKLANLEEDYYLFDKKILGIERKLYIHQDILIDKNFFVARRGISIFPKIDKIIAKHENEIRIGKSKRDNIPLDIFTKLIKNFPTTWELNLYTNMRIEVVIKNYLESKKDYEENYTQYMNKKISNIGENIFETFNNYEVEKYNTILNKLKSMLENEDKYSERQWQKEILQIIRLIYPKYIAVFEGVRIKDVYKSKNRYLDYMLVDANGNIDLVEIKKPFGNKGLVSKSLYRDNHVPLRELSGSIMQVEKYIFYLNKWGKRGEDTLTSNYSSELPIGFKIKITNPNALIIMGRDGSMNRDQGSDFEIIKRKYKNIIDILTYDDLIRRLENTISMFDLSVK